MSDLIPIEYQGQRILTTKQLAEAYQTTEGNVSNNFNNNIEHFIEGKHYHLLDGDALREFKRDSYEIGVAVNVNKLYLWTARGASRLCKILDTDKAWEQFDNLEETYFSVKELSSPNYPQSIPPWHSAAIGEIRFAKEFAIAAGIRTERVLAVALARIEKETGKQLGDYRKTLPAPKEEDAEILNSGQIGERLTPPLKASNINLTLEKMGFQQGQREPGKVPGTERLIKHNPWRLTNKGKEYGMMQDSAKQQGANKWEGFQIMWSPKTVDAVKEFLAGKVSGGE